MYMYITLLFLVIFRKGGGGGGGDVAISTHFSNSTVYKTLKLVIVDCTTNTQIHAFIEPSNLWSMLYKM